MDQTSLATSLMTVDHNERQSLLAHHADLVDVRLAWELKTLYDSVESSDPEKAIQVSSALSLLADSADNSEIKAIAAWVKGMVTLDAGEMEASLSDLDLAQSIFLAQGQFLWAAFTQVSKLRALAMLGRFDEAIECGQQARDVFIAHRDFLATGKIEQNLGNLFFMLDNYIKAEHLYRAARERYEVVGDQKQLAQIDNCLATTLTSQHRFREAEMIYEQALTRAEAAQLEVTLAEIETNQGCLALFQGRYDRALNYLEKSRRRYAALGMPHNSAIADQELADAYLELNLAPEAAAIYERVIPIFSELGMQTEQARALAYHGRAYLAMGHLNDARTNLAEARVLYKHLGNAVGEATVGLIESQVDLAEEDFISVAAVSAQTEVSFTDVHAWGRALIARWLQGDAARSQGRFSEAKTLFESALHDAMHWSVIPVIQRCYTSLGLLALTQDDMTAAEQAFKSAIASIEEARAPLPAEEFRTAFLANKLTPYTEMVRICLSGGGSDRLAEALGYVERARSRALLDMLAGALTTTHRPGDEFDVELNRQLEKLREELSWFYSQINRPDSDAASRGAEMLGEYYDAIREREIAISEITLQLRQQNASAPIHTTPLDLVKLQSDLGAGTVMVEYFSLGKEWMAFVIKDEGIQVVPLPGIEEDITTEIRQFYFQLGALHHGEERLSRHLPELEARARYHLGILYDRLFRPLKELVGNRRLLIVPHRVLHYVPFHALHDGVAYLIESHEICCVPSASVLHHCLSIPRKPLERALLVGVTDERNPRVRDEILALAALFPEAVTLLEDKATHASLQEHSTAAQILHLACHGHFRPDNPMFSSLQLSDGWFTVREAYRLNLQCELVTLSACETGVSVLAPGDEWIGLARSFFAAGAPSLLVSQWTVDDVATASLMKGFYSRLRAGAGPAAALRDAQCQMMKEKPHPYFWAPFVLVGRW